MSGGRHSRLPLPMNPRASRPARQRHKREEIFTSTDTEHGPRLLHPALCGLRRQPRHSSHAAGRGALRERLAGIVQGRGTTWAGLCRHPGRGGAGRGGGRGRDGPEGGPAPAACAWRPPAAAAAARSAPARLGSDGRGEGQGRRKEGALYLG